MGLPGIQKNSGSQETTYNGTYAVSWAIQEQSTDGVPNTGWVWLSELPDLFLQFTLYGLYHITYRI